MISEKDRNPGTPLDLDWVMGAHVNKSAVERRVETLPKRRTVKKEWQAAWLDDHGRKFGLFINNKWGMPKSTKFYPSYNPADGSRAGRRSRVSARGYASQKYLGSDGGVGT